MLQEHEKRQSLHCRQQTGAYPNESRTKGHWTKGHRNTEKKYKLIQYYSVKHCARLSTAHS